MAGNLIVGVSGIRGIVGESLTPGIVLKLSSAFGTILGNGKVIVGRDGRPSGKSFLHAVQAGLSSVGCDSIDLGIVPTPTVLCMVREAEARGGVVITASHNGPEWNGLKFVGADGSFLSEEKMGEVVSLGDRGEKLSWKPYESLGKCWENTWAPLRHVKRVVESGLVDVPALRRRRFSVVSDCVNGAASAVLPILFSELGCRASFVFDSQSEEFPRGPEPVSENLAVLSSEIKRRKADIGFAFDPDGDRINVVTNSGRAFGEENSIVLASKLILSKQKGTVVVNVSTTSAIDEVVSQYGSKVARSKVGERNVVEVMRQESAILGGEGNGGVILPEINWGRDGIAAAAIFLQLLLELGGDADSLLDSLPVYHMVKKKVSWDLPTKDVEERLTSSLKTVRVDKTDGVKVFLEHGWVHIRKSNTEPVLRIIGEAKEKEEAEAIIRAAIAALEFSKSRSSK